MERVKSRDAWINELSPYETQNLRRNTTNLDITMAWMLQQNLPRTEIPTFKFKDVHNHLYLNRNYITYSNTF